MSDDTPIVVARENDPLIVKHLKTFKMPDGSVAEAKPLIALCRCGLSKNKPFCDGSHVDEGWSDD
ncbi:MAG: CDGSH iron-sulfur domain-containing protein [Marinosulfonomonas sp.]|nr:CDGSH iron-sulfur domain-containing protein [Marinosulfonomonas sp.]